MGGQINEERERERDRGPSQKALTKLLTKSQISLDVENFLRVQVDQRERDYMGLNGTINERELDLQMAKKRDMSGKELRHQ